MEVLNKIASLILEDPFLTATQIAKRLGYAEEKTIYYWIDKAHYPGLVAFKRAVIRGRYRISGESGIKAHENPPPYGPGQVPIVSDFTADGTPVLSGEYVSVRHLVEPVIFAWQYHGSAIANIVSGDLLLATAVERIPRHRWIIAFNTRRQAVIRLYLHLSNEGVLINPETQSVDNEATPLYGLCQLYRSL